MHRCALLIPFSRPSTAASTGPFFSLALWRQGGAPQTAGEGANGLPKPKLNPRSGLVASGRREHLVVRLNHQLSPYRQRAPWNMPREAVRKQRERESCKKTLKRCCFAPEHAMRLVPLLLNSITDNPTTSWHKYTRSLHPLSTPALASRKTLTHARAHTHQNHSSRACTRAHNHTHTLKNTPPSKPQSIFPGSQPVLSSPTPPPTPARNEEAVRIVQVR